MTAPAACVTGWLAERFAIQNWRGNFVAAIAGMLVIYAVGASWLAMILEDFLSFGFKASKARFRPRWSTDG